MHWTSCLQLISEIVDVRALSSHTGGVAVDDGMACGGVGCADAVFAQNQPMLIIRCEVMNYRKGGRGD